MFYIRIMKHVVCESLTENMAGDEDQIMIINEDVNRKKN